MTKEESLKIFNEVKENHKRLDSCDYHHFVKIDDRLPSKFKCVICNGEIDGRSYKWYMTGKDHEALMQSQLK